MSEQQQTKMQMYKEMLENQGIYYDETDPRSREAYTQLLAALLRGDTLFSTQKRPTISNSEQTIKSE